MKTPLIDPQTYQVIPGQDVFLTITIGNAQIGGTHIRFQGNVIKVPDPKNFFLGNGSGLVGNTMNIITRVLDINPSTDHTIIIHTLSGGVNTVSFTFNDDADPADGLIEYNIPYIFI